MSDVRSDGAPATPRARLFHRLADLGIEAPTVPYPPHNTAEESKALRGSMAGTFTKNLLLKDKKSRHFLPSVHEDRAIDLKTLDKRLGANGQLHAEDSAGGS
jgi:Ala-tRNA(Pro) deacylase